MAKKKTKEKSQVRESKPLAKSPKYDSAELADNLKTIKLESSARLAASRAARKASGDKIREAMSSKGKQSGGSLYGLNAALGGKIVK